MAPVLFCYSDYPEGLEEDPEGILEEVSASRKFDGESLRVDQSGLVQSAQQIGQFLLVCAVQFEELLHLSEALFFWGSRPRFERPLSRSDSIVQILLRRHRYIP